MTRKRFIIALFLVLAGLTSYLLLKPKPLSDREAIQLLFQNALRGIRERNPSLLLSLLSENYQDSMGITYNDIKLNLRRELSRAVVLDLSINEMTPYITTPDASVQLNCTLLIQMDDMNQPLLIPLSLSVYLKKEKKGWKIIRIEGYNQAAEKVYGVEF
ncbi:hypothetical protein H5T87_00125 [bacterium]|nr:hypothetical protein [bacterium]